MAKNWPKLLCFSILKYNNIFTTQLTQLSLLNIKSGSTFHHKLGISDNFLKTKYVFSKYLQPNFKKCS